MSNYLESKRVINSLVNRYGELALRCGITHLMDCGINTFNEMSEEEFNIECENCRKEYQSQIAEGKTPILTDNFQIDIMSIARELSQLSPMDIFAYMQEHLEYSVGQNTINKKRMERIAATALDIIACELCNNDTKKFFDYCAEYEIDEEELCSLGWEKEIDELYEHENDEPDICND